MTVKTLELFGGIGAPRAALRNLGVSVKAIDYVEIDQKAVDSYNAMFAKDSAHRTQSVVGYSLKPDLLIHGSPCQDFSISGYQKGADPNSGTRSSLMWETVNIIRQMGAWKPRVVIWENVKNVLSKHMVHNFSRYLAEMSKLGYTNSFEVLNALDFGLPQHRERVFTVSMLDGSEFDFDALERVPTRPLADFLEADVDAHYDVWQPSMLKRVGATDGGPILKVIKGHVWTIATRQTRTPNAGILPIGDGKYRLLTERECWRLQGFSDADFDLASTVSSRAQLYKQAGNSIPVPVLEAIFKQVIWPKESESSRLFVMVPA